MQYQRSLKAPSSAPCVVLRPHARRPRCLAAQAAASAVCTLENAGDELWNKTYYPKLADTAKVEKDWYIIDAAGQKLGRLATLAATYVRGKHAPTYSPSMDMGAMIVIINCEQVIMSGDKMNQKTYMRHVNGKPGSYTIEAFKDLQKRIPERIVEKAVYGMLPKGRLGRRIRLNMKVYKGTSHPHEAQQPIDITDKISVSSHKH